MFLEVMQESAVMFFTAPLRHPSLIWHIVPLVALWIILEVYFAFYKHEKLGWNTALANAFSLFWITAISLQTIIIQSEFFSWPKLFLLAVIGAYGITLTSLTFRHRLSENISFLLAAPSPIHFLSLVTLLFAHDAINLDFPMIITLLLFFAVCSVAFWLLKLLLPSKEAVGDVLTDDEKRAIPDIGLFRKNEQQISEKKQPGDLEVSVDETALKMTEKTLSSENTAFQQPVQK